jgi:importin subunit beta-1
LEVEIKPQADRIMRVCLELLNTLATKSSVPETVFGSIGALSQALETDFLPYMEPFARFLYKGLENQEEPAICSMAIGLVGDLTRALSESIQPWCDDIMNRLLNLLQSQSFGQQFKPSILQTFGEIAQAINGQFEVYLQVVVQVLQQASQVTLEPQSPFEMHEYVLSLREGIMDSWDGVIMAMTASDKTQVLVPLVESIFALIHMVWNEPTRSEGLMRSCMGVVG